MQTTNHDPPSAPSPADPPPRLDTLPPEVLEDVFAALPHADLATVLRVNSLFLTTAYPLLYRHVVVESRLPPFRAGARGLSPFAHIHSLHVGQHDPAVCGAAVAPGPSCAPQSEPPSSSASVPSSPPPATSSTPHLPLLSLPATPHPNTRDLCALLTPHLNLHTLVLRATPLLYTRATVSLNALRVPRAILAFTPDSAVVGSNFKFEVAPDGPNGFLRRIPDARVVVWVFAADVWRPSPRPRNTDRADPHLHPSSAEAEDGEEGGGGSGHGMGPEQRTEKREERRRRETYRAERAYLARTWVGRLLSPAVLRALKARCPAVRALVIVNAEALDPVAVVDPKHDPIAGEEAAGHVGAVVRRWVARVVGGMEGWACEGEGREEGGEWDTAGGGGGEAEAGGGEGGEGGGDVVVRCISLAEFVEEERVRGTAGGGVRREEVESWFEE